MRTIIPPMAMMTLAALVIHAAEPGLEFTVVTASGEPVVGTLEAIGPKWDVRLGGDKLTRIEGNQLVSVRRRQASLPDYPAGEQAVLANGDRLAGTLQELKGEVVRFEAAFGVRPELKLSLSALSALILASPEATEQPDRWRRQLLAGKRARDAVYLRNGDVLDGVLASIERGKHVQIEVENKMVAVDFSKVAAITFSSDLVRVPKIKGPYARLLLTDGSRLTITSATFDGRTLVGSTIVDNEVRIPVQELLSLDMFQGPAVYLSDLKPAKYEFTPFLDVTWPYGRDGSISGSSLRVLGSSHDKGVSLRAGSKLAYDLTAGYRRFDALVGLDDRSPTKAAARIRVLVDGKPRDLGGDIILTPKSKPLSIALDVTNAKELTLLVELTGRVGELPGDVAWADARLIK